MTVNTLAANQPVAIDVAQNLLLESHDLSTVQVESVLGHIMQSQVDDADIYFQSTRSEGWSLEEGIVKAGSFSIDQGVGVRAISGEKTAFAYSDDISEASLLDAARTVRSISSIAQAGRARVPGKKIASSRSLYNGLDPIAGLDSTAKVNLLGRVEKMARAKDPRVIQVMAGLASEYDVVMVARADGTLAADVRPLVRLSVTVIAEQNGRREVGSGGGGGYSAAGGAGTVGQGYAGAAGDTVSSGGGGGGAGGVGLVGPTAGPGVASSISGASVTYARGGPGGDPPGTYGGGGENATSGTVSRKNGRIGIVIIRYLGPQRATGGTVTSSGGMTIHTFTTDGTFTVN